MIVYCRCLGDLIVKGEGLARHQVRGDRRRIEGGILAPIFDAGIHIAVGVAVFASSGGGGAGGLRLFCFRAAGSGTHRILFCVFVFGVVAEEVLGVFGKVLGGEFGA